MIIARNIIMSSFIILPPSSGPYAIGLVFVICAQMIVVRWHKYDAHNTGIQMPAPDRLN